jgi:hypothetical protein
METGLGLAQVAALQMDLKEYTGGRPWGWRDPFHDHRAEEPVVRRTYQDLSREADYSGPRNQVPGAMAQAQQEASD